MSEHDGEQPVVINVGACRCSGGAHDPDGDTVTLYSEPTLPLGLAARAALASRGTDAMALEVALGQAYLQHGIEAWSFLDDEGDPIAIDWPNILRLLPYARGGRTVADAADALYSRAVFGPLLAGSPRPSRNGSAGDTTSPVTKRPRKHKTSSKSSSPASTAVTT